jgi:O-methyltransferase
VIPLTRAVRRGLNRLGYDLTRWAPPGDLPVDFETSDREIIHRVQPYTMTPPERIYALIRSVEYVSRFSIPGAIVECGVWRGGSMMAVALTLLREGDRRDLYLYDTFAGMNEPTALDTDISGRSAASVLASSGIYADLVRAEAPLDAVRRTMLDTGYEPERLQFVEGPVEETIPRTMPGPIAILRLDTDWYRSTKHELQYLYPLLSPGGVLILDDYGHWRGARQATDEYLKEHDLPLLLCRTDYGGRVALKPGWFR